MLILGLALILIYAVVSFLVLSEFFPIKDDEGIFRYCSSLIECYMSVLREGLLDTFGGVRCSMMCILHPIL